MPSTTETGIKKSKIVTEYLDAYPEVFKSYEIKDKQHIIKLMPGWCWDSFETGKEEHVIVSIHLFVIFKAIKRVKPCGCGASTDQYARRVYAELGYLPDAHTLVMIDKHLQELPPDEGEDQ